jgi:hypothetical protein
VNDNGVTRTLFKNFLIGQVATRLTGKKLRSTVTDMEDQRAWFSEMANRRVTTTEIGEHLGVTRKTAQSRLEAGLSADDIITVARAVKINPMDALVELGKVTYPEVYGFVEREGKLLGTASDGELALELAQRLNSLRDAKDWWSAHEKANPPAKDFVTTTLVESMRRISDEDMDTDKDKDNVRQLTQKNQPLTIDDLKGLPYVAHTADPDDTGDATDHDFIP